MQGDQNELMDAIGDKIADRLLDMNGEVSEAIYTGVATASDDILVVINEAVATATIATLNVIDEFAQIFPSDTGNLGCTPWFDDGELQRKFDERYTAAINS